MESPLIDISSLDARRVVTMNRDAEDRLARIERLIAEFRAARQLELLRRTMKLRRQVEALARRRAARAPLPRVH